MFTPLKNRDFALLWLAQLTSGIGDVLYTVGVMVTIYQVTGSALQTVGVTIATNLPPFLFGPFAGVLVDQAPRRWVMVAMDLLRAGLVGVLLVLVQGSELPLWGIYLVVAGLAAARTFYQPARQAIIPSLVPSNQLVSANSLIIGTNQVSLALGYGLGGLLALSLSLQVFILFDLLTFLVAALLVFAIRLDESAAADAAAQASKAKLTKVRKRHEAVFMLEGGCLSMWRPFQSTSTQ